MKMRHFLTLSGYSRDEIYHLLRQTHALYEEPCSFIPSSSRRFIAGLFFENSTRTRISFEVATHRFGATWMSLPIATSSFQKGESLADTIKTLAHLGVSIAVIRHPQTGFYQDLLEEADLSIVNAGDGCGHHPSQCLLDLYTMYREWGTLDDKHVHIAGDISHSRVARSHLDVLPRLGARVSVSGPMEMLPAELPTSHHLPIDKAVRDADAVMMLRTQAERHHLATASDANMFLKRYGLTTQRAAVMKPEGIILHPAPVMWGTEIDAALRSSPRSRIFQQMTYGVAARMAIYQHVSHSPTVGVPDAYAYSQRTYPV